MVCIYNQQPAWFSIILQCYTHSMHACVNVVGTSMWRVITWLEETDQTHQNEVLNILIRHQCLQQFSRYILSNITI